ncbi:MAG: enoyl-CoA hydratase-related protein, partial [Rhizobiaceae bacterium]
MNANSKQLIHKVQDGTLWIGFNRPEARNALTFEMYDGLASLCSAVQIGDDIKAVVIYGEDGKAFAAGTDMAQFRSFKNEQDALDYEDRLADVFGKVEQCRVPTIAAINGA